MFKGQAYAGQVAGPVVDDCDHVRIPVLFRHVAARDGNHTVWQVGVPASIRPFTPVTVHHGCAFFGVGCRVSGNRWTITATMTENEVGKGEVIGIVVRYRDPKR